MPARFDGNETHTSQSARCVGHPYCLGHPPVRTMMKEVKDPALSQKSDKSGAPSGVEMSERVGHPPIACFAANNRYRL